MTLTLLLEKTRQEFFRILNIPQNNQTSYELLVNKIDSIKEPQKLMTVVKSVRIGDLPLSFKKIAKVLMFVFVI